MFECTDEEFKCVMGGKCINAALFCDGLPDCIDMSDEFHCGECVLPSYPLSDQEHIITEA